MMGVRHSQPRIGPMARRTDSRSRMIHAACELFRERGYYATAFSDVVEESGAPRGSIYFHCPGGKQELARETTARAADEIEDMVHQAASRAHDSVSLIQALAELQVQRLEASGYCSGCAIATMVLELAPQDEELSAEFDKVSPGGGLRSSATSDPGASAPSTPWPWPI